MYCLHTNKGLNHPLMTPESVTVPYSVYILEYTPKPYSYLPP